RDVPFEVVGHGVGPAIDYTRYDYPAQSLAERFTIRVLLRQLPPLGLRTLRVRRTDGFREPAEIPGLRSDGRVIQNDFVRVEAAADGTFFVTDRATGRRYGPIGALEDGGDAGDEYNWSPPSE